MGWEDKCRSEEKLFGIGLKYTQPRIYKAIKEIKAYTKTKPNYFRVKDIVYIEDVEGISEDVVSIALPLCRTMDKELTEAFELNFNSDDPKYGKSVHIRFHRFFENKRFWYPSMSLTHVGEPLCKENYKDILKDIKTYDICPCPENFKEDVCQPLLKILKRYSLTKLK